MSSEEKAPEVGNEPKKGGKKKLIVIIVVLFVVIGGAAGFFLMGKTPVDKEGGEEVVEEEKHYVVGELAPFVVNLSESSSFLKVIIKLEYDPLILDGHGEHGAEGGGGGGHGSGGGEEKAGGGALHSKLLQREHAIRDAIISVLSSKKSEEVLTLEGKEQLKEELLDAINRSIGLDESPVVAIYFTDFIVQ